LILLQWRSTTFTRHPIIGKAVEISLFVVRQNTVILFEVHEAIDVSTNQATPLTASSLTDSYPQDWATAMATVMGISMHGMANTARSTAAMARMGNTVSMTSMGMRAEKSKFLLDQIKI
jgi:hypothetical protein